MLLAAAAIALRVGIFENHRANLEGVHRRGGIDETARTSPDLREARGRIERKRVACTMRTRRTPSSDHAR